MVTAHDATASKYRSLATVPPSAAQILKAEALARQTGQVQDATRAPCGNGPVNRKAVSDFNGANMVRGKVDLHFHTECSGDSYIPIPAVIPMAERLGLRAIAKTDHDSVSGCSLLAQAAAGSAVEYIPAVELSAVGDDGKGWHILGFFVDYRNDRLLRACEREKDAGRRSLKYKLAAWVKSAGLPVADPDQLFAEVASLRPYGEISIKQICDRLVGLKVFADKDSAMADFARHTAEIAPPAHSPPHYAEVIETIHQAGGIALAAHPKAEDEPVVIKMLEAGLDGVECHNTKVMDDETQRFWRQFCESRNLAISGGTDWHGPVEFWNIHNPTVAGYETVETLRAAYRKRFGRSPD